MINEKILINYLNKIAFNNTPTNAIGATTSLTLRTVQSNDDTDTKYVRKFGKDYKIKSSTGGGIVSPRSDAGFVNQWRWEIRGAVTNTLFSSITDTGGVSVSSSNQTVVTPEQMIIKLVHISGTTAALVDGDQLIIFTDLEGAESKIWFVSKEVLTTGSLELFAADSGSTYYDALLKFGGFRRVANGTNTTGNRSPFYDIGSAYTALGGAFVNVVILDSESYDEELALNIANSFVFSDLGQIPTLTNGIGARVTREVLVDGNNSNTIYVEKTGNDSTGDGTFLNPFLTVLKGLNQAKTDSKDNVNIKDSGIYVETISFSPGATVKPNNVESLYGFIPTIKPVQSSDIILLLNAGSTSIAINIHGITFDGGKKGISFTGSINSNIGDNTIKNQSAISGIITAGIHIDTGNFFGTIEKNFIENSGLGGGTSVLFGRGGILYNLIFNNGAQIIKNNFIKNCVVGINFNFAQAGTNIDTDIENNIIIGCTSFGIIVDVFDGTYSGDIKNNTLTQNDIGLFLRGAGTPIFSGTYSDMISFNNITLDLNAGGFTPTITESNFLTNSGFTSGSGNISTDPKFCKITAPVKLGISSDSGALKQGTGGEDMGALFHNVVITANNIEINGLRIDGQEFFNNAFYQIVTRTGIIIKFCDIFDYQGIAIDFFGTADTDSEIKNTIVNNNGNGINVIQIGNTIEETLIFKNSVFGIFMDQVNQIINHCVIFGNSTGLDIQGDGGGVSIRNSIFNGNSVFGINSLVNQSTFFCCITDAISSTIDITDITNITDDPLFINTDLGTENFNIKTNEAGFLFESPCKNIGESGSDIGAFLIDRSLKDNSWRGHQFTFNPRNIDYLNSGKGFRRFENAFGTRTDWAKGHKRGYEFIYAQNQFSNEVDRKKLEFLTTLIQTEENERPASDAVMRLSFLPVQGLDSGTGATVDKTAKTLTDSVQDLVENELKGFHLAIQFETGTGTGDVSKSAKTLTVDPTPNFTVDEHKGFFLFIQNNFFFIQSNTSDTLTLSDPDENLSDASDIDWSIEKYFKIKLNEKTVFTLIDDDSELVDGTFDYIIRFIECKIISPDFLYKQARFFFQQETWKTGHRVPFEEA